RLAPAAKRERGVLPAHLRAGRLPLEGRRPRRPGHQGPAANWQAGQARYPDDPREAPNRVDPGALHRHAGDAAAVASDYRRHRVGCGCRRLVASSMLLWPVGPEVTTRETGA